MGFNLALVLDFFCLKRSNAPVYISVSLFGGNVFRDNHGSIRHRFVDERHVDSPICDLFDVAAHAVGEAIRQRFTIAAGVSQGA